MKELFIGKKKRGTQKALLKTFLAFFYVYGFLVGIKLLGTSLKGFGTGFAHTLISTTSNPFVGLIIGILTTATIQSSSATTSLVVGFVASGALHVRNAIPIIMGANIGTSVTNLIVSFTHITRRDEFKKAFPAAAVHDIFNLLSVLVYFPLEMKFHLIEKFSHMLAKAFQHAGGFKFTSPLKIIVKPVVHLLVNLFRHNYIICFIVAFGLVILFLVLLVRLLRGASSGKLEILIDRYLFSSAIASGVLGFALTVFVQSSSVTTSLIVPLVGAGLLTVEKIFPYTLGANVGTTFTAILASLVTGSIYSIQAAFAHLSFNILGIILWYPLRIVPIWLAKQLGNVAARKRYVAVLYVLFVFFIIPLTLVFIMRR